VTGARCGRLASARGNVLAAEPNNSFTIETSSAKPLPEVLSSEDILMHGIKPMPTRNQVLRKLLQNRTDWALANSSSDTSTTEQIL
jgi:hypothetical protein